jgi:hypothetical protein
MVAVDMPNISAKILNLLGPLQRVVVGRQRYFLPQQLLRLRLRMIGVDRNYLRGTTGIV